jgi:ankyrin repeat protein/predicted aspartyl protease
MNVKGHMFVSVAVLGSFACVLIAQEAQDLVKAALRGDVAAVQALLAKGADINANIGATALIMASQGGHGEVVQVLLAKGAEVNAKATDGRTALMMASQNRHGEVVQVLLAKGADVNAKANDGRTALMIASQNRHPEVVQTLLAKGADVNARANNGATALIMASQNSNGEVVQALLAKGADANAKLNDGRTALMLASQNGNHEVVQALLAKGADVNAKATDGRTALMTASKNGHGNYLGVVQALLAKRADVNAKANDGTTALDVATVLGHADIRALLLGPEPPSPAVRAGEPVYTIHPQALSGFGLQVSVRVNGAGPFWCLLDSGASQDLDVGTEVGKRAGLKPTSTHSVVSGMGGLVQTAPVSDVTLELDNLRIPHRTVEIAPSMAPLECIVGTRLFADYVVEVDYSTPDVRLYAPGSYRPATGAVNVPVTLDQVIIGRLLLQSGDAVDTRLVLDTGNTTSSDLILYKEFTDEQGILKRVSKVIKPQLRIQAAGGDDDILATRITRFSVGDVGIDNSAVLLIRTVSGLMAGGSLGAGFLHRFLVAIDVPHGRVYLTPNQTYSDPEPKWPWAAKLPMLR